jgi:hypothetical protein
VCARPHVRACACVCAAGVPKLAIETAFWMFFAGRLFEELRQIRDGTCIVIELKVVGSCDFMLTCFARCMAE